MRKFLQKIFKTENINLTEVQEKIDKCNLNKNQFDIAINIKKPRLHPNIIFGIVSDYLNQYESRYKVIYTHISTVKLIFLVNKNI